MTAFYLQCSYFQQRTLGDARPDYFDFFFFENKTLIFVKKSLMIVLLQTQGLLASLFLFRKIL